MEILQLIAIGLLVILLVEVSYLVWRSGNRGPKLATKPVFIDTSVLMDGRIISVVKTGFMGERLTIPRSVVGELQFLADNADHEKRARARRGLDVVSELQAMPDLVVDIHPDGSKAEEGVDERLLKLAKQYGGIICTIDYNLNKVATVEGIRVLNINELAQSLRMAYLPGERMMLELVQKGNDAHQGVGYLPDGTMVVVEHASAHVGQVVGIEFIRSLQTAAGRMMFARMAGDQQDRKVTRKHTAKKETRAREQTTPASEPAKASGTKPVRAAHFSRKSPASGNEAGRRPRTSQQREADLISLVDKQ